MRLDPGADSRRRVRARSALRHAGTIVASSERLAREIARFGRRAELIRYTANAEDFPARPIAGGPPSFLYVGEVSRQKGVDLLLEAFAKLEDQEVHLHLIGRSGDLDISQEAAELGITDRVRVSDEIPRGALAQAYADASCVVMPSRHEDLGTAMVEGLLVGRPVIAVDDAVATELISPGVGVLVPGGDAEAMGRAMQTVLTGLERGQWTPERLRAHALSFSWATMAPKLEALTWQHLQETPSER